MQQLVNVLKHTCKGIMLLLTCMQKLNVVELYCGCGGLSFVDRREKGVHIETKWAVDMEPSMCAAFQANYPNATVCRRSMAVCHKQVVGRASHMGAACSLLHS